MLREELTGYDTPVPFYVKSNKTTINFQTDGNNWGIPNFEAGNAGQWALDFTVIYPNAITNQDETTISSSTESYVPEINPGNLDYACIAECNWNTFILDIKQIIIVPLPTDP